MRGGCDGGGGGGGGKGIRTDEVGKEGNSENNMIKEASVDGGKRWVPVGLVEKLVRALLICNLPRASSSKYQN